MNEPRLIAVDWSGRSGAGQRQAIWLAEVIAGELVRLEGGRTRTELIDLLIAEADRDPNLIVGFDFAFSLPAWYLQDRQLTAHQLWALLADEALTPAMRRYGLARWMNSPELPFWTTSEAHARLRPEQLFRRTENDMRLPGVQPKSVFQLVGAGQVGRGSLTGMQALHRLAGAGFRIWPFDPPGLPLAVEIFPRVLTGPVRKNSPSERERYLEAVPVPPDLRRLAAAGEDAFDAAVSAVVMAAGVEELRALPEAPGYEVEGQIWRPHHRVALGTGRQPHGTYGEHATAVAAGRLLLVSGGPSPVFGVADRFVRRWAELEPTHGLIYGLAGTPGRLSDWSPEGRTRVADALRHALAELDRTPPRDGADRRAAAVMGDRLQVWLASAIAQDWARELDAGFLAPPAMDRMALATAPLADAGDAELLASRLTGVPAGMLGYTAALQVGLEEGRPGAGVLAERLVAMLRASARSDGGFFGGLAAKAAALAGVDTRTARHLREAGRAADAAYDQLAQWLEREYLPRAAPESAVGPERYRRALQEHLGLVVDPVELAAWGWEELDRLERELRREAAAGWPGVPLGEVLDRLDHDPAEPSAAGPAELLDWLGRLDQQVARRLAEEFDIPPQLRVLRHELAPPGSAAGGYYLPPTEDGARPGVVVWTMPAEGRVPLWRWQTFSHHEGMPGHHLELGGVRFLAAPLSRFQTGLGEISGYSEGWALYAERFMDELGAFDRPATRLGFLISQTFRAIRVGVDTGLHLGLRVPAGLADPAAGEVITPEVAVGLLVRRGWQTQDFARSEVLRYLGCPGRRLQDWRAPMAAGARPGPPTHPRVDQPTVPRCRAAARSPAAPTPRTRSPHRTR